MTGVSRIPGMNAMSVFHDQWAISWDMNTFQSQATIAPAVVLTYIGTGAPAYDLIQKTNVESYKEIKKSGSTESSSRNQNSTATKSTADRLEIERSIAASFICTNAGLERQIVLESPSVHPMYACRVIYNSEKGLSVPWYAKNESEYCKPKAIDFVAKQISWGWSCVGQ